MKQAAAEDKKQGGQEVRGQVFPCHLMLIGKARNLRAQSLNLDFWVLIRTKVGGQSIFNSIVC